MKTPVGIIGFRGYSGAELAAILSRHPHVEPVLLEHREAGDGPDPIGQSGPRRIPYSPDVVRSAGLAAVCPPSPRWGEGSKYRTKTAAGEFRRRPSEPRWVPGR